MKLVMPHGGYGLGNDLIPWAKGYILSQELGAKLLHPAWGNNPRAYWRYFSTSRLDRQWYRVLVRVLPRYAFDECFYREVGENDFVKACKRFAEMFRLHEKRAYIVTITGLWGAFSGLETAKHFVRGQLYATRYTKENLCYIAQHTCHEKLSVAMHIRRGDFRTASTDCGYEGVCNTALPITWYKHVCSALVSELGADNIQFLLASDGSRDELGNSLDNYPCLFISGLKYPDCSDLISMSEADLLVCSLSTYSMWAAFLSDAPYIWFAPQLDRTPNGLFIRLVREFGVYGDIPHAHTVLAPRGFPVGMEGNLPDSLLTYLKHKLAMKNLKTDLIRGGVVPVD